MEYFKRVHVKSEGHLSGYFSGCTGYRDDGHLIVLLSHCRSPRLRRPFPLVGLDPPTIEVGDPQNYEGFVPLAAMAG